MDSCFLWFWFSSLHLWLFVWFAPFRCGFHCGNRMQFIAAMKIAGNNASIVLFLFFVDCHRFLRFRRQFIGLYLNWLRNFILEENKYLTMRKITIFPNVLCVLFAWNWRWKSIQMHIESLNRWIDCQRRLGIWGKFTLMRNIIEEI